MSAELDTSTPERARAHARAQEESEHALRTRARPTIPVARAVDLPADVDRCALVWDEMLAAGGYTARVLERGSRLRIVNSDGDACIALLAYNADQPEERLNVADTVKVQWQAYLAQDALLLSDMGRVLLSIVADTSGRHDALCGVSTARSNAGKYGDGAVAGSSPSGRDRFVLALAKHGLGRRDVCANINLFKSVRIERSGDLVFDGRPGVPGEIVELRAEMRVLVALVNGPHVLDPRAQHTATHARVLAWRGPLAAEDDAIRTASPEHLRAFQNVEDYYNR
jgi:uncharacterized protein